MSPSMRRVLGTIIGLGLLLSSCGRVDRGSSKETACGAGAAGCGGQGVGGDSGAADFGGAGDTPADSGAGGHAEAGTGNSAGCDGGTSCKPTTVCRPGSMTCVGEQVAHCNSSGSAWLPPVDCAVGEVCRAGEADANGSRGECKPQPCEAGFVFCKDSDVYLCAGGGSPSLVQACGTGSACQALIPGSPTQAVACLPTPCSPGETSCVGDRLGTCAADGKSLSQLNEDCIAQGN